MNESQAWFYADDEQTHGPMTATEVEALIRQSVISPATLLCPGNTEEWQPAQDSPFKNCFATSLAETAPESLPARHLPSDNAMTGNAANTGTNWKLIAQRVLTVILRYLLVAGAWMQRMGVKSARYLKDFSYHRHGRPLIRAGWNGQKIAIIMVGSAVALWLICALIMLPLDLYQHRRGNPANVIYPIIGEPVNDVLSRFEHTKDDVEPGENGLSQLTLLDTEYKHGTMVYLSGERVVAFWRRPMRDNLSPTEREVYCNEKSAKTLEGFIWADYRELSSITSNGNEFKDRFGHKIIFAPFDDGSLLVSDEAVLDKLGVQSLRVRTLDSPGTAHSAPAASAPTASPFSQPSSAKSLQSPQSSTTSLVVKGLYIGMPKEEAKAAIIYSGHGKVKVRDTTHPGEQGYDILLDDPSIEGGRFVGGIWLDPKNNTVKVFYFETRLSNFLFNTDDQSPSEFAQTFINSYNVPTLTPTTFSGIKCWSYVSPYGWTLRIMIDKTVDVSKNPERTFD